MPAQKWTSLTLRMCAAGSEAAGIAYFVLEPDKERVVLQLEG